MEKEYIFHSDPGHGWLEVELSELYQFGIANKITKYSYQDGYKVYLEEDCDASLFADVLEENGFTFKYKEKNQDSTFIRRLPHYHYPKE